MSDLAQLDTRFFRSTDDKNHLLENSNPIITTKKLTFPLLNQLLYGDILAIRIPDFCSIDQCQILQSNLDQHSNKISKYDNAPELDIYRFGLSYFETRFNFKLIDQYFRQAHFHLYDMDQLCQPAANPLRDFLQALDQAWPHGAKPQQLSDKLMMPGLIRILHEHQAFSPHQDLLNRDIPQLPKHEHPISQLAINLYIQNFQTGGELELWDYAPDDEVANTLYTGTHDFYDRAKLPPVAATLTPQAGELILFQSSKVHAVNKGQGGKRIAFSCFSAFRGINKPLSYWI